MNIKPITTEKAVKLIDVENTILFEFSRTHGKEEVKKYIEALFGVKIEKIRTLIRKNKKIAYVKLTKDYPAIDVATKIGMI